MAHQSQDWDHRMKHRHESPAVNILLTTKLLSLNLLYWDTDCLLTLWPLLIPCSLDNDCCTFWFSDLYRCRKKFLVQQPIYTHRKIIKASLLHQRLGSPCLSFFLSTSPSLSLPSSSSFSGVWKPAELTLLPGFSRPPQEGALCLREGCKPCFRVLLVLGINQGILASFFLSLSYCRLQTTRFWSIKGPQQ